MQILQKYKKQLTIAYMVILALYPLLRVTQGLSVVDTTYSLSNFAFFSEMEGTWMVATYLANVLGSFLMSLPFGGTMLGINIYTSLLISLTGVTAFIFLKRDIDANVLFIGELIALSLCWGPSVVLYNYLTYFLFTLGALILYRGLCGGRDDCYVAAGIILGMNVSTRFPNITEAALVLAVWYVGIIERKKIVRVLVETGMCIGGYIIGFAVPVVTIAIRYNATAFTDMIRTLFAMTDKATDYKTSAMVTAMFEDYIYGWRWLAMIVCGLFICALIFVICDRMKIKKIAVPAGVLVMLFILRVCYGNGMFSLRYYEYGSMYYLAIAMIAAATVMCVIYMCIPETNRHPLYGEELTLHRKKIMSAIVIIVTYVTCLGSNNAMFPIVNNLFIVAPFVCFITYGLIAHWKKRPAVVRGATVAMMVLLFVLLVQSIGFHSCFALQDGDEGEGRTAQITGYQVTNHIYTNETNAANLQGLMDYMYAGDGDADIILYGDIPGLGYLLNKKSALTTFWPDLNSYTYAEWDRDMAEVEQRVSLGIGDAPVIITSIQVAAWEGGDETAIDYFGIDRDKYSEDKKLNDLVSFMHKYDYKQTYCNDGYSVYAISQ